MTIRTSAATGILSIGMLLFTIAPSLAASTNPADTYRDETATLHKLLDGSHTVGTRRQVTININRHMAEWLHDQGKDAEALGYLGVAIGQASQAR